MLSIMVISFFSLAWLSCSQPLVIKSWLKPGIIPMIWENGPIFITFVNCSYLHMEWSYSVSLGAFVDGNEYSSVDNQSRFHLHVSQGEFTMLQFVHEPVITLTCI